MAGRERATALIAALHLQPRPEGGHFAEVYRSATTIEPGDGRPGRAALTTIYFRLMRGTPRSRDALRAARPELAILL